MACHPDAPFTAEQEARIAEIVAAGIRAAERTRPIPSTRTCARSACPGVRGGGEHDNKGGIPC